jgi:hypothetical protein
MKVQVLTRTRVATYSFDMEPISVERIDVLESRMRDLQEEVKALRVEATGITAMVELQESVKKLQSELSFRQVEISDLQSKIKDIESTPLTIQAESNGQAGNAVRWVATGNYSNGSDGIIRNLEPGTYQVIAVVNYASGNGQTLQLMRGGQSVQLVHCPYVNGNSSSVLSRTMSVGEGDELSVVCTTNRVATSYLTVMRLGS